MDLCHIINMQTLSLCNFGNGLHSKLLKDKVTLAGILLSK